MIINLIIKDIKMTTQTARTTILTTPDFKIWLADEAKTEGISVSELVRLRCKAKPNEDELLLNALIKRSSAIHQRGQGIINKRFRVSK